MGWVGLVVLMRAKPSLFCAYPFTLTCENLVKGIFIRFQSASRASRCSSLTFRELSQDRPFE